MKPPICCFCTKEYDGAAELVYFADFVPLENGKVGHPHGMEWFCGKHKDKAKGLIHLPIQEAIETMRKDQKKVFFWKK